MDIGIKCVLELGPLRINVLVCGQEKKHRIYIRVCARENGISQIADEVVNTFTTLSS